MRSLTNYLITDSRPRKKSRLRRPKTVSKLLRIAVVTPPQVTARGPLPFNRLRSLMLKDKRRFKGAKSKYENV
jgi:hypothetical protein